MSKDKAINKKRNSDFLRSGSLKSYYFFKYIKKVPKEVIVFGDTGIEKHKYHFYKNLILIDDVDIDKTLISNKIYFGKKDFKCFLGYKDNEKLSH